MKKIEVEEVGAVDYGSSGFEVVDDNFGSRFDALDLYGDTIKDSGGFFDRAKTIMGSMALGGVAGLSVEGVKDAVASDISLISEPSKAAVQTTWGTFGSLTGIFEMLGDTMSYSAQRKASEIEGGRDSKVLQTVDKIGKNITWLSEQARKFTDKQMNLPELEPDPEVITGNFLKDPSLAYAATLTVGVLPSLAVATVTGFATGNPALGGLVLGMMYGEGVYNLSKPDNIDKRREAILAEMTEKEGVVGKEKEVEMLRRKFDSLKYVEQPDRLRMFTETAVGTTIAGTLQVATLTKPLAYTRIGAMAQGFGTGVVSNAAQEFWRNIVVKYGMDESQDIWENVVEGAVGGGIAGGIMGVATPLRSRSTDKIIEGLREKGMTENEIVLAFNHVAESIADNADVIEANRELMVQESESVEALISQREQMIEEQKKAEQEAQEQEFVDIAGELTAEQAVEQGMTADEWVDSKGDIDKQIMFPIAEKLHKAAIEELKNVGKWYDDDLVVKLEEIADIDGVALVDFVTTNESVGKEYKSPDDIIDRVQKQKKYLFDLLLKGVDVERISINDLVESYDYQSAGSDVREHINIDIIARLAKFLMSDNAAKEFVSYANKEIAQEEKRILNATMKIGQDSGWVFSDPKTEIEQSEKRIKEIKKIVGDKSELLSEYEAAKEAMAEREAVQAEAVEEPSAIVKREADKVIPEVDTFNPDDVYKRLQEMDKVKKSDSTKKDFGELVDRLFVPLSTRAAKIDEGIKDALRKHAFSAGMMSQKDMAASVPFMQSMSKMESIDATELDFALKNRDDSKIDSIVKKYGIEKEYESVRQTLDNIFLKAKSVGMDVRYLEDYFPRRISDVNEFIKFLRDGEDWGIISKALQDEKAEIGRDLTQDEKAQIINSLIRGYGQNISLAAPGNIKERQIVKLTPEMNAFYKDSGIALSDYIRAMNDNIAARAFFGKGNNLDNSIGNYIAELIEQKIVPPESEAELKTILKSYFNKRGTYGIVTAYKNFSYIATMGSPISAITQIGDLAFSLYQNGFFGTVKAMANRKLTKQDIGIDIIAEEFTDQSRSSRAVSSVFKAIGLDGIDAFGKEVLINGAFNRLSKQAKAEDKTLAKTVNRVFGSQRAEQVLSDLKNMVATDEVKYMLFAELADFQPIALTEMPEAYVSGGNSRLFYMLKSYTIKQLDVYHNKIFLEKNPVTAVKNAVRLSMALALMGATADVIKDVLLRRPIILQDLVINNILKLVGFSKWQIYKTRNDGFFQTLLQSILPPVPFVDEIYKDALRISLNKRKPEISKLRIWNSIPIVGKFYYWWFGGGTEISKKAKQKNRRR